jgi:hypothetical protein
MMRFRLVEFSFFGYGDGGRRADCFFLTFGRGVVWFVQDREDVGSFRLPSRRSVSEWD